ncbi:MAG: hypothetical protein IPN29_03665 [Saprospiraceae bacterium]|nr:hypothetical protein [Saprospiraceae bacterium]
MKKLFILFCFASLWVSCSKDECVREDFIGTWKGTEDCDTEDVKDIQVVITAGNKSNEVIINGGSFVDETVEIDGCDLDGGTTVLGIGIKIKGSLTAGELILNYDNDAGIISVGCEYKLTR